MVRICGRQIFFVFDQEKDLSFWEKICDQYDSGKQAELQLEVENLLQKMLKKAHQEKIVSDHDADAIMNIDTETSQNAAKKNIQSVSKLKKKKFLLNVSTKHFLNLTGSKKKLIKLKVDLAFCFSAVG